VAQPQQPDRQQLELIAALAAYQGATAALRLRLAALITRIWQQLGSYRANDMRRFIRDITPLVAGAQQQASALTAANLARQQQISLGGTGAPVAVGAWTIVGAAVRNGADPATVYERPFHLVWRQLADLPREAGSIDQAIQAGLDRAVELAMTDLQLAKTETARQVMAKDKNVVAYRRVLEGQYSCGLCIVAATLRYHSEDLMPIHPGCDCSVAPIHGDHDPGRTITAMVNVDGKQVPIAELPDVHDRIEQRFGRSATSGRRIPGATAGHARILQYRDLLIVHQHGELGPVLGVRGAPFTGPTDI
jgi:hypothetical protein